MKRKGQLTIQRKAVYDIVSEANDHPTASDIIERLKLKGYNFAYGTVYNSLRYLTEEEMIRELKLDGDSSRYDARTEEHQHIVCTACGRMDEVFTTVPADWVRLVSEETGYDIQEEHVLFKGVCSKCREAKQ